MTEAEFDEAASMLLEARRTGRTVAAGTWVITGSCSGAPAPPLDRRMTASFDGLGAVSVAISSGVKS